MSMWQKVLLLYYYIAQYMQKRDIDNVKSMGDMPLLHVWWHILVAVQIWFLFLFML